MPQKMASLRDGEKIRGLSLLKKDDKK